MRDADFGDGDLVAGLEGYGTHKRERCPAEVREAEVGGFGGGGAAFEGWGLLVGRGEWEGETYGGLW